MKIYNKAFSLFLTCVMIFVLLTGCDSDKSTDGAWEFDKDSHWHLTESGKKTDVAAHSLDYFNVCSVCDVEITNFDGEIWVSKSNENGDKILWITYDEEGNVVKTEKHEYTYDDNGNWVTEKVYENDVLDMEYCYTTVTNGEESNTYAHQVTSYNEDGTKLVEICDENSMAIKETMYNADGSVEYEYTVVNEFDDMDSLSGIKKYDGETLVSEIKFEYNDYELTTRRTYEYGTLVNEDFYTTMYGNVYLYKEIIYNEDGTQTVIEYDEYGEVIE